MKRYQVTGIPISPPFDELAGRRMGDVFDADIDPDIEGLLVGGGALRIVEVPRQDKRQTPVAKEDAPKPPESKPEPVSKPTTERSSDAAEKPDPVDRGTARPSGRGGGRSGSGAGRIEREGPRPGGDRRAP